MVSLTTGEAVEPLREFQPGQARWKNHKRFLLVMALVAVLGATLVGVVLQGGNDDEPATVRSGSAPQAAAVIGPAASPTTGRYLVSSIPEGFRKMVGNDEPTIGLYTETYSNWDGNARTRVSAPAITITTFRGLNFQSADAYVAYLRTKTIPGEIQVESSDTTIRGKPALLARVRVGDKPEELSLYWLDGEGLAIQVITHGVTLNDAQSVAEGLRAA